MARKVADNLPKGYATKIPDGTMYGEALLVPTILYSRLIQKLLDSGVDIHYMSNITGHGWKKIMRHPDTFTYRMKEIPPVPPVLDFIVEKGPVELTEAYSTFNMGAGFAVYVPEDDVKKTISISKRMKIKAYAAGTVEKGPKQVIIEPLDIVYKGENFKLRA